MLLSFSLQLFAACVSSPPCLGNHSSLSCVHTHLSTRFRVTECLSSNSSGSSSSRDDDNNNNRDNKKCNLLNTHTLCYAALLYTFHSSKSVFFANFIDSSPYQPIVMIQSCVNLTPGFRMTITSDSVCLNCNSSVESPCVTFAFDGFHLI